MTDKNNSSDSGNNNSSDNSNNSDSQNNNSDNSGDNQKPESVPLSSFLDQKKINKELKEKLSNYQTQEKDSKEAQLLEDKKYQELIQNKETEISEYKTKLDQEVKANKTEKLRNKVARKLAKLNAIDSDDALVFIKVDDLLDHDAVDSEIEKRTGDLLKNKAYLFNTGKKNNSDTRSKTENGQPTGSQPGTNDNKSKMDPTVASLADKLRKN